jgi:hypothetical protein
MRYWWVSEVARKCGVPPKIISQLFYDRQLSDDICPVVGGRRLIPDHYVGEIERLLRQRGSIPHVRKES